MRRLGILLSGRGSNFEAIADRVARGESDNGQWAGTYQFLGEIAGNRITADNPEVTAMWTAIYKQIDRDNVVLQRVPQLTNVADAAKNPIIRIVRISRMVADATYRRMRGDFLRLHRQFVMGNERRYHYDFFMICCGPMSLRARVEYPDRAVGAFAPDGACAGLAADEMLK